MVRSYDSSHNKEYSIKTIVLINSDANQNCIQEGIIPSRYFEKTAESLSSANGNSLNKRYKLSVTHICN